MPLGKRTVEQQPKLCTLLLVKEFEIQRPHKVVGGDASSLTKSARASRIENLASRTKRGGSGKAEGRHVHARRDDIQETEDGCNGGGEPSDITQNAEPEADDRKRQAGPKSLCLQGGIRLTLICTIKELLIFT